MDPLANRSGASVSEAASKIKGLLSEPPTPTDGQDATKPQEAAETQSQEQETLKSDTEATSRRRKAKIGDREIEFEVLTEDFDPDLVPTGLMMEADYRKKTMSHAEKVKEFESKKSEFDSALAELQDSVMLEAKELESKEMLDLKENDPNQYWYKFEEIKSKAEKLKAFKDKRDKELAENQKKLIDAEQSKYTEVIPEWLDDEVKTKETQKMVGFLSKTGFSNDEIGSIYDSRIMSIVRKAALFDEISSKKHSGAVSKPAPKSLTPSSSNREPDKTVKQSSMERLRRTGKTKDAAAAIKKILGG